MTTGTITWYEPQHVFVAQVEAERRKADAAECGVVIIRGAFGPKVMVEPHVPTGYVGEFPDLATYSAWLKAGAPSPRTEHEMEVECREMATRYAERVNKVRDDIAVAVADMAIFGGTVIVDYQAEGGPKVWVQRPALYPEPHVEIRQ